MSKTFYLEGLIIGKMEISLYLVYSSPWAYLPLSALLCFSESREEYSTTDTILNCHPRYSKVVCCLELKNHNKTDQNMVLFLLLPYADNSK